MINILRFNQRSTNIYKNLWNIFAHDSTLSYGSFVFLEEFSNKSTFKQFESLYMNSIKNTFKINNKANTECLL